MKHFYFFILTLAYTSIGSAQVFITELADPNNSAGSRYVELYNAGGSSIDLSTWALRRWTNGNTAPQNDVTLSGTIAPGNFIIYAANSTTFSNTFSDFSGTVVQLGSNGPADSNGDDNIALIDNTGTIVDIFGVPGEDGANTCHEFEDGRAERVATVTSGNGTWNEAEWNVWADTTVAGCTNHTNSAQSAPTDFDPGDWVGTSEPSTDTMVQFTATSITILEDVGSIDLTFEITNEDVINATSFDVVLTTGDATDINGYTTQTVTFPAASSMNETLTVTITDDTIFEGDETLTFNITSVTGGNNATIGSQSTFDLTIEDNESSPAITIVIEDFDGTFPNWNNDIESQRFVDPSTPNEGLFIQAASSNNVNFSGNTAFGRDLAGENGEPTLSPYTFTFNDVDVSDYTSITVSFDYHTFANAETGDYEIIIDGIGQGSVEYFNDPDTAPGVNGTITVAVADGTSTVGLQLTGTLNGGSDIIEFDNFKIEGIYNGYAYSGGSWYPAEPDATTGASNAIVADGVVILNTDVNLNDVIVNPGAAVIVASGSTLTVNNITLESTSRSFSSLITDGNIIGTTNYNRFVNVVGTGPTGNGGNDLISLPLFPSGGLTFDTFLATGNPANASKLASQTTIVTTYAFGPYENNALLADYQNYDSNSTENLLIAKGYRAATTIGETLTFTGEVLQTNQSIMLTKPLVGGSQWNLIGNPFASYVDAQAWLDFNDAILDPSAMAIYAYNSGTYSGSGDTTGNFTIINNTSNNTLNIAPGQAFFVAAGTANAMGDAGDVLFSTGSTGFPADMRTTSGTDDFIEGRANIVNYNLKLALTKGTNTERTSFYFNDNSTLGLDPRYDAATLDEFSDTYSIYSHLVENNEGRNMAIQSLSTEDLNNISIPLGINSLQGEELTFSIACTSLPNAIDVYLEDTEANTITLLNSNDYITTPITDLSGTGRFFIRFSNTTLSRPENLLNNLNIFTDTTNKTIIISGELYNDTDLNLYDIQGRLIKTNVLNQSKRKHIIDVSNLTQGIYVIELKNINFKIAQKIILK